MSSAELVETALSTKNMTFDRDDSWITFEVIENGELGAGRRVHPVSFMLLIPYKITNRHFFYPDKDATKPFLEVSFKAAVTYTTTRWRFVTAKRLMSYGIIALIFTPRR